MKTKSIDPNEDAYAYGLADGKDWVKNKRGTMNDAITRGIEGLEDREGDEEYLMGFKEGLSPEVL